ncbi:MAG: NAD-dependent epimerase/dehydratase family protein [Thermoleophilaceae bacterium]
MSAILVTGGAGFVGSHLVDALLAEGERVRVLDNLDPLAHPGGQRPGHLDPNAELIVGDLRDRAAVDTALEGVDRVFHLGGVVGNGESMVNVRRAVDSNCGGTATLMEAVIERRDRVRRIVAASSMVVYGEGAYACGEHGLAAAVRRTPENLRLRRWEPLCELCGRELEPVPISESAPLSPTSVYGITKRDQEELVLVLGAAYGVEAVALRYLGIYGPRQALGNPYTGVAAIFASRILAGRRPILFEDGGQIRDLVHVADVVRATISAMRAPAAPGSPINVATGHRTTILDLAGRIAAALGSELEPEVTGEFRAGDIRHCFADVGRARDLLGFEAERDLDAGLSELARWVALQTVEERGDGALRDLRARGLLG